MRLNQYTDRFTRVETRKRMRDLKEYVQRFKNQRVLFFAPKNHSEIKSISLIDYDCFDEYNFVSTVDFSESYLIDYVKENSEIFKNRDVFRFYSVVDYVDEYFDSLRQLFSVTCFCLVDKNEKVTCKAVVCLGSLHHAPRILYRVFSEHSRNRLQFDKLSAYDHLH